jgi:hypothetical protein
MTIDRPCSRFFGRLYTSVLGRRAWPPPHRAALGIDIPTGETLAEPDADPTPRAVGGSLSQVPGLNPLAIRAVVMIVVDVALRWKLRFDCVVWRYFSHVAPP